MPDPVFDLKKHAAKLARARRRADPGSAFLHVEAARLIGERLAATNRHFKSPAMFFDGPYQAQVLKALGNENPPIEGVIKLVAKPLDTDEILDLEPSSLDLAVSIFDLHHVNSLPNMLVQIHHALKPDGLFMAVLPCEGTLKELRASLLQAESELTGSASSRIDLFPDIRLLGDLVRKIGFRLPVVDLEVRTVRYSNFEILVDDLRNAGAGNCHIGPFPAMTRTVLARTRELYSENHADQDGKLRATVAMACISGWKEDISQQKPLRPGAAKNRLSDFL